MAETKGEREVDVQVAEKVFGWPYAGAYVTDGPLVSVGLGSKICPRYTADASADHEVHESACKWHFSLRRAYFVALDDLLQAKTGVITRIAWPEALQFYRVGDYSRAALKALEASHASR
jgi:hypothetical protein